VVRDLSRSFCGLGTTFGEPPWTWSAEAFRPWTRIGLGLPVQLDHDVLITSRGVTKEVGRVTDLALLDETSSHPGGLLVLGYLDAGPVGDRVLEDVRSPRPGRPRWGLSIAARVYREAGTVALVLPEEVSVTLRPRHRHALVLAVGDQAREVWEHLAAPRTTGTHMGPAG
jgi:hypothetical protein